MNEASAGTISMPEVRSRSWRLPAPLWPAIAAAIALVPFLPGLRADRMFFVEFRYRPQAFLWGAAMSARAFIIAGALAIRRTPSAMAVQQ